MLVTFHCQASGWYPEPAVSWMVNGSTVDRGDYNTSSLQDLNDLFNSTSVLSDESRNEHYMAPKTPQDYTVVIAVTVSVCTIILLAMLILILYYRKKLTKSSSKNKVSRRMSVADETRGKVNLGYHIEDVTSLGHHDLRNRADSTINIISPPRVPDIVIFSSQKQKEDDFSSLCKGAKTVRRVTTV
ncbi:Titin [Labeo rohita]|uniref:Titin n=1 Tax=Labeo rohita TaxID=84645 RepID=A0ABQ8M179_LABRO|nr:Titin [Labeo rohita]